MDCGEGIRIYYGILLVVPWPRLRRTRTSDIKKSKMRVGGKDVSVPLSPSSLRKSKFLEHDSSTPPRHPKIPKLLNDSTTIDLVSL